MKWEAIEPNRNNFTFTDADRYRDFAKANKKEIHCHTLVWHSQLPPWVAAGNYDNKTLIGIMESHIKNVAGRYKDVCTRWDVSETNFFPPNFQRPLFRSFKEPCTDTLIGC
jgi:endo-1,4-beta-xylanase